MLERFARLPSALQAAARWRRLGDGGIPVMLVHPDWDADAPAPVVIWMHGRTARKELDPGRYLRLMRSGIGVCAVDLPGHGERFESAVQDPAHTLDLIVQMIEEIDTIVDALRELSVFDTSRMGIGGMSAGGMAALSRLCRDHRFQCASVEAATGSWNHQRHREMFEGRTDETIMSLNPMANLMGWREIPLQAIHSRGDTWVSYEGQAIFLRALRARYRQPDLIELITYDETGAPFEHAGFGRMAADAKEHQRSFFARFLTDEPKEAEKTG